MVLHGFPSYLHTTDWHPILRSCEETRRQDGSTRHVGGMVHRRSKWFDGDVERNDEMRGIMDDENETTTSGETYYQNISLLSDIVKWLVHIITLYTTNRKAVEQLQVSVERLGGDVFGRDCSLVSRRFQLKRRLVCWGNAVLSLQLHKLILHIHTKCTP